MHYYVIIIVLVCITIISDATLQLFGSSINGFGSFSSDADICITFEHMDSMEVRNFVVLE